MNKDFAPYQPSFDMKELGFDEPCFGFFWIHDKELVLNLNTPFQGYHKGFDGSISAPTYSQAFRWFREKYDLDSYIMPARLETKKVYDYYIWFTNQKEDRDLFIGMNNQYTYEEAELACLIKLIEIVKTK